MQLSCYIVSARISHTLSSDNETTIKVDNKLSLYPNEVFSTKNKICTSLQLIFRQDKMSNIPGSNTEEDGRLKVDLDTLLAEEIGEFGRYQAGVLALSALAVIFSSWSANEYIFTTARINTRLYFVK